MPFHEVVKGSFQRRPCSKNVSMVKPGDGPPIEPTKEIKPLECT
jgi:hypothetical protein